MRGDSRGRLFDRGISGSPSASPSFLFPGKTSAHTGMMVASRKSTRLVESQGSRGS